MKKLLLTLVCLFALMAAGTSLKAQEVTIVLNPGWTWISCPMTEAVDFSTALGDFTPMQGDVIQSLWGLATYTNGHWRGTISQFYSGYGYMYKSNRTVPIMVTFNAQQPTQQVVVITSEPTDITTNSATSGGSITTDAYVFAKGICWAAHSDPTPMDDDHSESGGGDESFTAEMTELSQNTMYYVRAYVVTQDGIAYGNEVSFSTIPIWTIEATSNPTEGGTITGAGDYEQNAICNLTAIANEGYIFANWTENGEVVSTDATYTFTVDAARTLVANFDLDHTYVDLGLPSGTLWATCNLGANLPEEYGDYFAWGETQPKDNFSWTNYQYCMGSFNTLTKYCNNPDIGYNGFTDNLTTLEPSDDAATANWGDDWRMPTDEEWQELYQNTTVTWTTRNGVNGRLFTASNGNSLFLPASGYRNESTPEATGIIGDYWTSSLDTDYPSGALSFFFNSSNYYISFCNRLYGRNVRAVRSVSQSTSFFVIDATANPVEGGVVIGGGSYQMGAECTLNATASDGYTFINWTENGEMVSMESVFTFTVTESKNIVANFTVNPSWPNGVLPGYFSVSSTRQVQFSQGNLQYIGSASTPYWKFAENQWECLGSAQDGEGQNIDRDLFGWGTSGWDNGNYYYRPWNTSYDPEGRYRGFGYGPYNGFSGSSFNLTGNYANSDWGVYNRISNGGNLSNQWRTLTMEEWVYVFNTRNTVSGIRYAKANVNNVNGMILLPDNWDANYYSLSNTNTSNASFSSNILTALQWSILEQAGAVFLPAAGQRSVTSSVTPGTPYVFNLGIYGYYWSVSWGPDHGAYCMYFHESMLDPGGNSNYRCSGFSVRLVRSAQ